MKYALALLTIILSSTAYSSGNFSAEEITSITTYSDERVSVLVKNYYNPGPGSTWDCSSNWVYLGTATGPAPKAMLAAALSAQARKEPIRFGIYGSGSSCFLNYLTVLE